ncbi:MULTISPECIES: amino acid ABC transporter permease [unclassified Paenibacillus]|uniref:amino acid ABC transporter permease n=1 Tax=unclassified Paenibacillus TaxID=185978 RepID=UPI00240626CC|nr:MULTISPECIES: amino acid ABC transporter permease [unclassified Paenibacillus]MDF9841641.1 polar amino acid transport system permease protein [Paenibacillus sp. PastF-2]MDF9848247.1 polar amino acid transport system permease protein [Paenibacillus sp. PastM-2]MDF9854800.1 polar amino acid transport system permease protein [Paenibacillus sp. PastF-1]MDH6480070.1 polar amino acid transport system permease protein [Paenibacillus sp. PastH-2]MDH6507503.1 polar amino acid transport system permea
MTIDFSIILDFYPALLRGLYNTMLICACSLVLGMLLGVPVCMLRMSGSSMVRFIGKSYINVVRGTPFLVQVYLLYYVGPLYGLTLSAFACGVITLTIFGSAYFSEIYRSGVESVPKGHLEAASSLGMSRLQAFKRITFPQMMALIIPMLTNQLVGLVKESAILSTVTVHELTFAGTRIIGETFRYFEVYIVLALLYWILNTLLAALADKWEAHFTRYMKRSKKSELI